LSRRGLLRAALYAAIAVLFAWSLVAIVLSGPVMIRRPPKLELEHLSWVSADRLRHTVEHLSGELAPRSYAHPAALERAAEWIAAEFRRAGLTVQFQDYELPEGRFRNVVAFRQGLEAGKPVRVLGAHYDTYGDGPGADDNASGFAVLLELVRTLAPLRPRRSQYFVAFCTEEPPFFASESMGSHVFARSLRERGVQVDLMAALDLVGYYTDAPRSQGFPLPGLGLLYPREGNFVAVVGDLGSGRALNRFRRAMASTTDLPIETFRGPRFIPGLMWSDHWSFRRLGFSGVLITDTAFLRYPWYHTDRDTPDRLDYERMAELVRGLHGVVFDRDVAE
jgi:hypothetical protein